MGLTREEALKIMGLEEGQREMSQTPFFQQQSSLAGTFLLVCAVFTCLHAFALKSA